MKTVVAILLLAAVVIYLLVGAVRSWLKWEEEKRLHRRFGGDAPPKKEVRKLKP